MIENPLCLLCLQLILALARDTVSVPYWNENLSGQEIIHLEECFQLPLKIYWDDFSSSDFYNLDHVYILITS